MDKKRDTDRSYLYGRLEVLLRRYEDEARASIGMEGVPYIDINYHTFHQKPYTTVNRCFDYLYKRTDFARIFKAKNPEMESELSSMIMNVFSTLEDLYGDNDDPLYYACVFGAARQERELQNA